MTHLSPESPASLRGPLVRRWLGGLAAALLCAALTACGGGGSDDSASDAGATSTQAKAFKGRVTEITGPTTFSVEGIAVDASSASIPTNLAVGTQVKVDGVMANGVITATKVEFEGAAQSDNDDSRRPNRIEGRVTAFNSLADFAVDGIPVNASGAERVRGTVAVGVFVDVRGIVVDGVLIANRVKVEDSNGGGGRDDDDDDSTDDNGVIDELEGTITAFTSNTSFTVGSTPVNASGVGSIPAGLRVGVRVEMDGRLTGGVFVATTLKIDD
jgi:hypothetical protein